MKKQFIILFLVAATLQLFSQSQNQRDIKDFFIPEQLTEMAKAIYEGRINKHIYYLSKGNQKYEILYEMRFKDIVTSRSMEIVTISRNEVSSSQTTGESVLQKEETQQHKPAKILLKLPESNKPVSWTSLSSAGDIEKCTATLTTMIHRGKEYEAIKVTKENSESHILEIDYYLKDIGFYKTVFFDPKTNKENLANEFVRLQVF